jgi:hypothetical protein
VILLQTGMKASVELRPCAPCTRQLVPRASLGLKVYGREDSPCTSCRWCSSGRKETPLPSSQPQGGRLKVDPIEATAPSLANLGDGRGELGGGSKVIASEENLDVCDGAVGVDDDAVVDVGKGTASLIGEVSLAPVAGSEEEEECKG